MCEIIVIDSCRILKLFIIMKCLLRLLVLLSILFHYSQLQADQGLLNRLNDDHARGVSHWIYNDLSKAQEEAKRLNQPIFVTFRCVPCHACKSVDAEVAKGNDKIMKMATEKFVSLRQVEMKGVDLSQFQFDYDLNWAAMFINADGTVYGRYGTQSADGPDAYNSVDSLLKAMERVLVYPNNKGYLTAKKGAPKPYKTAIDLPGLPNKRKYRQQTERSNCIHCHNIHDALCNDDYAKGKVTREYHWRYPLPENVGLKINKDDGQLVQEVETGSAAAMAGLKAGDRIVAINNQAIISIADMQWVFHNLSNQGANIQVSAIRNGAIESFNLITQKDWKKTNFSWRGSMWNMKPKMGIWMPFAEERDLKRMGLTAGHKAMQVKWINHNVPTAQAAQRVGLRTGDFIIAIEGKPITMDHRELNYHIKLKYKPGDTLPMTLWRKGQKIDFNCPLK